MSKPTKLSHPELAIAVLLKVFFVAIVLVLLVFLTLPDYAYAVVYGVVIFFINNIVFALLMFRPFGIHSSYRMIKGFLRGVFFKLVFFALSLLVVFKLDNQGADPDLITAILTSYFLLQIFQIVFSAQEAKKL